MSTQEELVRPKLTRKVYILLHKAFHLNFRLQFKFRVNPLAPSKSGYFILSIKSEKIKVVNADSSEISLLTGIIRRHTRILSEGWERHMTWTIRLGIIPSNFVVWATILAAILPTIFEN